MLSKLLKTQGLACQTRFKAWVSVELTKMASVKNIFVPPKDFSDDIVGRHIAERVL
jgi:hypothetical protein